MSNNAARLVDGVSHGGLIITGDLKTWANGLPLARKGDIIVCKVHGLGRVAEASKTVHASGSPVARKGHGCTCAGSGSKSAAGLPSTAGPGVWEWTTTVLSAHGKDVTEKELIDKMKGRSMHFESKVADFNRDGVIDTSGTSGSFGRIAAGGNEGDPGKFELDVGRLGADGTYIEGPGNQGAMSFNATAYAVRMGGEVNLPGGVGSVGAQGTMFQAQARGYVLNGDDGRRVGYGLGGGAEANAVEGELRGQINTTAGGIIDALGGTPFGAPLALGSRIRAFFDPKYAEALKTPIQLKGGVNADAGSAGGFAGAQGYYDRVTEQVTVKGEFDISVILGFGFDFEIIGGKEKKDAPPAPAPIDLGPNVISSGAGTVFVGG